MKWFVGLLGTLLCVFLMLSCTVGSEKGKKSMAQLKMIAAVTTPTKRVSGKVEDSKLSIKSAKLWKRNVVCPDGQSQCPDGDTCCKLSSGAYGCCPVPNAVCCSDGVHCCPNGYTCGAGGFCQK
ncbi:hypothetical protein ACROYT_G025026 [Oculina patagonica]